MTSSNFYHFYFFVFLASCFFQQTLVVICDVIRAANVLYYFGTSLNAGGHRPIGGSLWHEINKMALLNTKKLQPYSIHLSKTFWNKRHTFAFSFFHNRYFFVRLASCFFQQTLVVVSHVIRATDTFHNFGTYLIAGRLRFMGGSWWHEEGKWHRLTSNNCAHKSLTFQNGIFLQQETYLRIFLFSQ